MTLPAPRPPRPRNPAVLAVGALALLGGAVSLTACSAAIQNIGDLNNAHNEKEDLESKKQHYEEAAQTYYDGGKYGQSAVQWRRLLELEPDRPKANWGLAKSLEMVGTPQALRESIAIFERIIDWDWTHPTLGDRRHEVMKDFAQAYSELADFYDEDIRVLKASLEDPKAEVGKIQLQIQQQTAKRNELLQKAIPLFQGALQRSPNNPYCVAGLAKSYLILGQDQLGIQYARQYIAISVANQTEWAQQLKDWEEGHGDVSEEQRAWFKDKIRGARDKEMKIRLLLGSVLVRDHDYYGAVKEYTRVLEIDPAKPAALVERAQAYGMAGDYKKAIADLEQYMKITDPVKQRQARINAAELLDKYRMLSAKQSRP